MPVKDHVQRETLPWRPPETRTECGRQTTAVGSSISRADWQAVADEWHLLVRDYRRAGMPIPASVTRPNVCQTCWDRAAHNPTWERNPIASLHRFLDDWASAWIPVEQTEEWHQIARELWALGRLAEALPDRMAALVDEMRGGYRRDTPALYR